MGTQVIQIPITPLPPEADPEDTFPPQEFPEQGSEAVGEKGIHPGDRWVICSRSGFPGLESEMVKSQRTGRYVLKRFADPED